MAAGTLDYKDMTDAQREVYKAYLDNEQAQNDLKESTEELRKAKKAETQASIENQLALSKEGNHYEDFKATVVDAYKSGKISAEEARDYISRAMANMSDDSRKTFVEDSIGVSLENVEKLDITKGKFIVKHHEGEDSIPLKNTHGYEQTGCNYCMDYVAELSDFSCGSVGAKEGWSTVIKRTDKGASLIDQALEDGVLEQTETNEGKFGLGMLRKLATNKKTKNQKNIDQKLEFGIPVPFAHSKDKDDVFENR